MLGKIVKNFDPSVMYTANPRTVKTDQDLCSFQYQLCYTPFYGSSMYYFQGKKRHYLESLQGSKINDNNLWYPASTPPEEVTYI